jgi:uncharacterized protein
MEQLNPYGPLNDDQLDRLSDILTSFGGSALNIEEVDGLFTALICGPDVVLPSEYLPTVWGADYQFADFKDAQEVMDLLMCHWNTIANVLQGTLEKDDVYLPIF